MTNSTDRIEKQIQLRAPQARVWLALTDYQQFGTWFQAVLEGPFVPGERSVGRITYPGYEHLTMELFIEKMEPEGYFSFRWHPYAVEEGQDYSNEPTTLVEFLLEAKDGGTFLRVTESGFDQVPAHRRDEAFRMNSEGWAEQLRNIEKHVGG
jgi:uncharacterized protein YndB with AHSA1/START domain